MSKAIILHSGVSVRQGLWDVSCVDLPLWDMLKNAIVFSTNYNYRYYKDATFNTFYDWTFYLDNKEEIRSLPVLIGILDGRAYKERLPNTYFVNPGKLNNKGNLCGIFSLALCVYLGFEEIYLLGADFCSDEEDRTHFYQDEVDLNQLIKTPKKTKLKYYGIGKTELKNSGKKVYKTGSFQVGAKHHYEKFINIPNIYNVSEISTIPYFKKLTYQEFYDRIKDDNVNQEEVRTEIVKKIQPLL